MNIIQSIDTAPPIQFISIIDVQFVSPATVQFIDGKLFVVILPPSSQEPKII
jgi:hypothetical protein